MTSPFFCARIFCLSWIRNLGELYELRAFLLSQYSRFFYRRTFWVCSCLILLGGKCDFIKQLLEIVFTRDRRVNDLIMFLLIVVINSQNTHDIKSNYSSTITCCVSCDYNLFESRDQICPDIHFVAYSTILVWIFVCTLSFNFLFSITSLVNVRNMFGIKFRIF